MHDLTWWHVEQGHRDGCLGGEDRLVRHGPLLREGQASQLRGLREGLLELEGHVLGAKKINSRKILYFFDVLVYDGYDLG
jgi:hypothetical protein